MRDGLLADELERRADQYAQAAEAYRGRVGPSDYVQAERLDARAAMCRELAGVYGGVRAPDVDDGGLPESFTDLVRDDDRSALEVRLQRPDAPDRRLQFIRAPASDGWRLAEFELEGDADRGAWHHAGTEDIVGVTVNGEPLDQLLGAGHTTYAGPGARR